MRVRLGKLRDRQSGAALVEFAVLAPLLLLLVLGIVEFGWKFGQFNDVRHAVREGARFAAVNAGSDSDIADAVCQALDGLDAGITNLDVIITDSTNGLRGEDGRIRAEITAGSLTNVPLISTFLPAELASDVEFRLEQNSTNWDGTTDTTGWTC